MKLLVAALDAELVAFPEDLPGFDRLVTGPGKLQATYALTRALDARDYDGIVVVGTAGAIDARMPAGVHDVSAAIQHDVTDIDGIVGQHVSLPARVHISTIATPGATGTPDTDAGGAGGNDGEIDPATGAEAAGVVIATGDHFVDDVEAVESIRPLGASLVDMETYAYAWVAAQFGVPLRVLKAVSDRAQDGAIQDWREAVAACSAELWEVFRAEELG